MHRSFDSTYCAQLQSAAAHAQNKPNAILDLHTVGLIAASAPGFLSGKAVHYCAPRFFTSPVNIQRVVASTSNAEYACSGPEDPSLGNQLDPSCSLSPPVAGPPSPCATTTIPCTGLDTEEVKQGITEIAVAFFESALKRTDHHGIDFERYLAPKWLMEHVPMVGARQRTQAPAPSVPPARASYARTNGRLRAGGRPAPGIEKTVATSMVRSWLAILVTSAGPPRQAQGPELSDWNYDRLVVRAYGCWGCCARGRPAFTWVRDPGVGSAAGDVMCDGGKRRDEPAWSRR